MYLLYEKHRYANENIELEGSGSHFLSHHSMLKSTKLRMQTYYMRAAVAHGFTGILELGHLDVCCTLAILASSFLEDPSHPIFSLDCCFICLSSS